MALKFQNAATAAQQTQWSHWFFYGESGAGKTTSAGTFPRPLFLVPAQERSHVTLLGREDVDFALISNSKEMDEALCHLEDAEARARPLWNKGDEESLTKADTIFPWQTIVIESVSHYSDLLQEELTDGGKYDMTYAKWGKIGAHMRNLHARLRRLPVHAVFTALEDRSINEKKEVVDGGPMFPGKMSYKLPSACDAIVYFEVRQGKPNNIYTAHFRKHGVFPARVRYAALRDKGHLRPFDFTEVRKLLGWP